jgi:hypothetical protein
LENDKKYERKNMSKMTKQCTRARITMTDMTKGKRKERKKK